MQNLGVSGAHANGELSILELNYLHKLSGLNTSRSALTVTILRTQVQKICEFVLSKCSLLNFGC